MASNARARTPAPVPAATADTVVMFLDCPAYADKHGTARCGLPAALEYRYTVSSSHGPVDGAKIRCPRGHWFNGPVGALTWQQHPAARTASRAGGRQPTSR